MFLFNCGMPLYVTVQESSDEIDVTSAYLPLQIGFVSASPSHWLRHYCLVLSASHVFFFG